MAGFLDRGVVGIRRSCSTTKAALTTSPHRLLKAERELHPYVGTAEPENRCGSQAVASDRDVEDGKRCLGAPFTRKQTAPA